MKKSLLLLPALLLSASASAQRIDPAFLNLPNSEINMEALYSNPHHGSACVADFNEDGYADIIITGANYDDMQTAYVNLLLNNAGEGFTRHSLPLQPVTYGSIAVSRTAPKQWIVAVQGCTQTAESADATVAYTATLDLGGAQPVCRKQQDLDVALSSGDMLMLDVNSDGHDDLLQFGSSNRAIINLNDGNGLFTRFTERTELKGYSNGQCISVDMNGDGLNDIVEVDASMKLRIFYNNGDNSYRLDNVPAEQTFEGKTRLAVADFDGDSRPDLVVVSAASTVFFFQEADGIFTELSNAEYAAVEDPALCVGDFDNDGNTDVLYSGGGKAYMLLGNGQRGFTVQQKYAKAGCYPDIFTVAPLNGGRYYTADFDGDQRPDVLAMGTFGTGMGGKIPRRADLYYSSRDVSLGQPVAESRVEQLWKSFPYTEVQLGEGRLKQNMDKETAYLKSLDFNKLFAATLEYNLGDNSYQPYGDWEAGGGGCSFAHYTSALSMLYAQTGDEEIFNLLKCSISIMRQSQEKNGDGFWAFRSGTTWAFDKMAKEKIMQPYGWDENGHPWGNNGIGFPLYAHHKVLAAMRDAYVFGGIEEAREGFLRFCDWFCMWVQNFDEENMNLMLESEHGGMAEVLADAYALSGKDKYLKTARRFLRDNFANTIAAGIDDLSGRHSNMYCPVAVGAAVHYLYSADERSGRMAHNFFDIVYNHHTLANGGNGSYERFGTPDLLTYRLGMRGSELCCSYNMLKLARELFCQEGGMQYLDYYENAMINHVAGSLSTTEGEGVCYYTSMKPNTFKCYDNLYGNFWCCVGTGMESHVKYVDALYFHNDNDLLMAIYTPSQLDWKEKGLRLTVETTYPASDIIKVTINEAGSFTGNLCLRYPSWAKAGDLQADINGQSVDITAKPGEIARLSNEWSDGDVVTLRFKSRFRLVDLPDDINVSALFYGPVLMASELTAVAQKYVGINCPDKDISEPVPDYYFPAIPLKRDALDEQIVARNADKMIFRTVGLDKAYSFKPFYDVHDRRYNVYYKFSHPDDAALERTVIADYVVTGNDASEKAHNGTFRDSYSGYGGYAGWGPHYCGWRDTRGSGFISFDLNLMERELEDGENYYIQATYFGDEPEEENFGYYGVYVDNELIFTEGSTARLARLDFAQRYYKIPRSLTDGKKKITVKFANGRCSLYFLRLMTKDHMEKPTGIASVEGGVQNASGSYAEGTYTIAGVKLEGDRLQPGLYIIDGKKNIVR